MTFVAYYTVGHKKRATFILYRWTFKFHKVVRQQNSGAVEDFILPYSADRSLSTNPKVKELLKSVNICQSYRKNKSGKFFMAHGVYVHVCFLQTKPAVLTSIISFSFIW